MPPKSAKSCNIKLSPVLLVVYPPPGQVRTTPDSPHLTSRPPLDGLSSSPRIPLHVTKFPTPCYRDREGITLVFAEQASVTSRQSPYSLCFPIECLTRYAYTPPRRHLSFRSSPTSSPYLESSLSLSIPLTYNHL